MAFDRLLGEAYILMRADGTLIPKDVREAGKKAGKGWSKEFDKELKNAEKGSISRFRRTLAESTNDIDFSRFKKEFGDVDQVVDGVNERLKELRANNLITEKSAAKVTKSLNQWAESAKGVAAETKRVADSNKGLTQFFKDQEAGLKRMEKARTAEALAVQRSNKAYETYAANIQFSSTKVERALKDQNAAWLTYGRNVDHTLTRHQRALDEQNAAWVTYGRNVLAGAKSVETVDHTLVRTERSNHRLVRGFHSLTEATDRFTVRADHFASLMGRAFGKGSRNNFVNWVGSMVGGLSRLGTALITLPVKAVVHVISSFSSAFTAARDAGAGFVKATAKGLLSIVGGFKGIAGIFIGVIGGAIAFGKVLPGLVSLITQLGGVVSALVGSIGIGLTGALLAVTPAAIGAVAALGGVFAAITVFRQDKDNKDFMEKIFTKPLEKFAKQFYPQMRTFFRTLSSGWKRLLAEITPSTKAFFDSFESKFKDKSTQAALDKWAESLGRMATSVSKAVTSFGSGFVGFFTPVLPYAERLTRYIEGIAARFDKWANSKPGQNAIRDFMHDAWVDAKLVWDILGQIGGIFGTVFSSGDQTGVTFLTGIRDKLKEINDFLKTPGGRKKLDDFFGNVAEVGKGIGQLAIDVGNIVKNFNDPSARAAATDMMNSFVAMGDAAVKVSELADAVGRIVDYLSNPAIAALTDIVHAIAGDPKDAKAQADAIIAKKKADQVAAAARAAVDKDRFSIPGQGPTTGAVKPLNQRVDVTLGVNGFTGSGAAAKAMDQLGMTPVQIQNLLPDFILKVKADGSVAKETLRVIQAFQFTGKTVPIKGNETAWNQTKGTVAGYAFDTKVIPIEVNSTAVTNFVTKWNRVNLNKTATIHYAVTGKLPNGGTSFAGGKTARGGMFHGAQQRIIGEAGPEAVVPLDRPLNMVDPSVRALSAIAQGLKPPAMAAGGIGGLSAGASIVVEAGALQVTTAATNPNAVGRVVLNRLGDVLAAAGA